MLPQKLADDHPDSNNATKQSEANYTINEVIWSEVVCRGWEECFQSWNVETLLHKAHIVASGVRTFVWEKEREVV